MCTAKNSDITLRITVIKLCYSFIVHSWVLYFHTGEYEARCLRQCDILRCGYRRFGELHYQIFSITLRRRLRQKLPKNGANCCKHMRIHNIGDSYGKVLCLAFLSLINPFFMYWSFSRCVDSQNVRFIVESLPDNSLQFVEPETSLHVCNIKPLLPATNHITPFHNMTVSFFNPSNTKRKQLYLKTQFVAQ